jgi:hypothetical protein
MMRITKRKALAGIAIAAAAAGWSAPAFAQATRTWVSGVGDDVNPCSRTAPCKTFAGAISKTAAGGEINCLDPGGFGAVTITKSITINCLYTEGGVLAGGNGIVVNDSLTATPGTAVVFLRGLDFFGVNPPSNGVRITSAAEVHIEDSTIRRFNAANSFGVSFQPASATQLFITRTTIANNGNGATGGGILVQPTGAAGSGRVVLRDVLLQNNANNALRVDTTGNSGPGVSVFIERSQFMSSTNGISVNVPSSNAQLMINESLIGLNSGTGITVTGAAATARVSNTTITGNATGVTAAGGATINTYGNNRNDGNGAPGAFTLPALPED